MASYEVLIKRSAVKEIEKISTRADRRRVVGKIQALAVDPRPPNCQKLSGSERYRVRQGNYRIVYAIEDEKLIVYVVKVGHRKDI